MFFFAQFVKARQTHQKTQTITFLFTVFLFSGLGAGFQCLSVSVHPDYADYFLPWVSLFGSVAIAGFVVFSFYFQRSSHRRTLFEYFLWICLSSLVLAELVVAVQRLLSLQNGYVEFRSGYLDIPSPLFFLLAQGILFGRLCQLIALERRCSFAQAIKYSAFSLLFPLRKLPLDAAALRAFLYLTSMLILIGVVLLLRSFALWDWSLVEVINSWLILLVFSGFSLAYLNYVPERSSFLVKLTGTTLTAVLMIVVGIVWLIGPTYQAAYQDENQLRSGQAFRFELNENGAYLASRSQFYLDPDFGEQIPPRTKVPLSFEFPYFDESHGQIFPRLSGKVGFMDVPIWRDIQHRFGPHPAMFLVAAELAAQPIAQSGLFVNSSASEIVLTWNRLVPVFADGGEYTFQLRLYPTGTIEMVFADIPTHLVPDLRRAHAVPMMTGIVPSFENRLVKQVNFLSALPTEGRPMQGLVQYHRIAFLAYLDQIYRPLALFVLFSFLVTVIVFPRLLQVNLNRPLQDMIKGVRRVMNGDLSSSIPLSHRDEIGFLATSFNEMTRAQRNLIETLEQKVNARTAESIELAERNARLEERHHMTRDLHDSVSQTLYSANLIADTLPTKFRDNPGQAEQDLKALRERNHQALQELRQLFEQLRPDLAESRDFGSMIATLTDRFRAQYQVEISIDIEGNAPLTPEVQLAFFRTLQECLNNIVKHANASKIYVCFDGMEGQAMLKVSDNGCGFDPSSVRPGSLGLQFMRERLEGIGAILELSSQPEAGTTILVIWMANDTN